MSRIGTNFDISGKAIKDDDTYLVKDNTQLDSTIVSTTELYPGKATRGHSHDGQEEVYIFTEGHGEMALGSDLFEVNSGDVIVVKGGVFHRVWNTSKNHNLKMICIFEGNRNE